MNCTYVPKYMKWSKNKAVSENVHATVDSQVANKNAGQALAGTAEPKNAIFTNNCKQQLNNIKLLKKTHLLKTN